jgi:L-lysine exporter family protein LysE/ArgO
MEQFFEGFFMQSGLILVLGAQNLFILESGLQRRRHLLVATMCTVCDVFLIFLGVLGTSSLLTQIPWLKILFGAVGVVFLTYYGFLKVASPMSVSANHSAKNRTSVPARLVIGQTLAFSLLNPHAYLDAIVLIGGYASQFASVFDRLCFGLGACVFSLIWFFGLAYFASAMSHWMNNPKVMRRVFRVSGVILLILAAKLGWDVWKWYSVV